MVRESCLHFIRPTTATVRHRSLLAIAAVALIATPAADTHRESPKRPKLDAGADTSDVRVLADHGNFIFRCNEGVTQDAFDAATASTPSRSLRRTTTATEGH